MKKLGTWLAAFVAGAIALQAPIILAQEGHANHEHTDHGHEQAGTGEDSDHEHAAAVESGGVGQHDHARDHDPGAEVTGPARFIQWLGKFHPIVVHFPIALLVAAAVAELLHMATNKQTVVAVISVKRNRSRKPTRIEFVVAVAVGGGPAIIRVHALRLRRRV